MSQQPRPIHDRHSRRTWLARSSMVAGGLCLPTGFGSLAVAQEKSDKLAPLNRFPRMVQEFFVDQVRQAEERGTRIRQALKTKADAEAYVKSVQAKIQSCFGPWPEKTPLNAKVTGVVERETYKIEKVIFESRPGFYVTANLYIPKNRKFPLPGVVGSCGHSANGKAGDTYQSFAQSLAKIGYVVFIFDPIGQGERLQYVDENLKPRRGLGTGEHLYAGNQQFIVDEFFGSWRAWDGIRALDYLLTREEVDPKHVGITGNSGGGTMTTWLCGVDQRWTMAAPGCFVTTFRRNCENELPADTEQCPPRVLSLGLDHADFLAALAPKPVIILAKELDYFDARGSEEAFGRLKHLYTLLGAPDNVALHIGPTGHGYSVENREAMYRWFNRATGQGDTSTEPAVTIETDETLACTPHGQVAELRSRTVFSYTQDAAIQQGKQRPKLDSSSLKAAVTKSLRLPDRTGVTDYRILRAVSKRGYPLPFGTNYVVDTEPGVTAIVTRLSEVAHYARPPRGKGPATLYVAHHSSDVELRDEPLIRELLAAEPQTPLFTCDARGIGDSRPDTCGVGQFLNPYGNDYFYSAHAIMLDRPYVGQKTHDVLCVLDWLAAHGYDQVHLVARGWGALPGAFAALLSDHVKQVTLKGALSSYEAVATSEQYNWPLSSFVPGVLKKFDLPDVYRELEKKKLRQIEPAGAVV
jgi:cephalosporin-C deacetylase-like acetyl esterase